MRGKLDKWMKGYAETVRPGSTIDYDMVTEFIKVAKPATKGKGIVQCGIPYGYVHNDDDGVEEPLYLTFRYSLELGKWVYCGKCIRGATSNQTAANEIRSAV